MYLYKYILKYIYLLKIIFLRELKKKMLSLIIYSLTHNGTPRRDLIEILHVKYLKILH